MFLVELKPGREELYRTSDELALAIRNGDVDPRSRIYHRATAKWISITLHPQYKAIITAPKEEPAARPARKGWTFLGGITPAAESSAETVSNGQLLHRYRRPLALGISGVLLMLGVQLAFSGPRPPWAGRSRAVVMRPPPPARVVAPKAEPKEEIVSLASTTTVWSREEQPMRDTLAAPPAVDKTVPVLPRAPKLRSKALGEALPSSAAKPATGKSIEAMLARYAVAHDSARARLESGMRVARLARLFAAPRLSPDGGVTDTRMSLAGMANFIRVFRQQQAAIESAYQDSVTRFTKQFRWSPEDVKQWYARPDQTEDPALKLMSGSLLVAIDSVLGVLDAQAGAYKITGSAIAFEDSMAAKTYGELRRRIREQIDAAVAAGGGTSAGPAGLLLQAIGTTTLPRET